MTVSQSVVFVGSNTQTSTSAGNPLALWSSDGTSATEVIPEPDATNTVSAGTAPVLEYSFLDGASVPGSLVFAFSTSSGAVDQLYATDPATGTPHALDVPNLGTSLSYNVEGPGDLVSIGSIILFSAADASGLSQLWRSNGTAAGTVVVPVPGASASGIDARSITTFGNGALFSGSGVDNGTDLFFTDGTTAGTREIAAFPAAGAGQSIFVPLGAVSGREIFLKPGPGQSLLFSTDGTAAGTVAIAPAPSGTIGGFASPASPGTTGTLTSAVGNYVLFSGSGGLYATDGTTAGTAEISPVQASELVSLGNEAVFASNTGNTEFGVTDGTAAGTTGLTVAGLPSGVSLSPYDLTRFGSQVLFFGSDITANGGTGSSYGLWTTDGTSTGTREIAPGVGLDQLTVVAGATQAYFSSPGGSLYVTDGTAAGTYPVPATAGLGSAFTTGLPSPLTFTGAPRGYVLAPTAAGALQARDLTTSGAAPLDLPDARVLAFGDGSTALFDASGTAEDIARIYLAAYSRAPDLAGLLSYTEAVQSGTMTLLQVADGAAASSRIGANIVTGINLNLLPLSNSLFLYYVYAGADGRDPDPGGLAAYTAALQNGQSRGQVLLSIAESPEAQVHSLATAGDANVATITQLYEAIDGRAPDVGGLIGYTSALDAGQSIAQIATAMLAGSEYASSFGSPTNSVFVTDLYHNLLARVPDAGGLASYTAALNAGESRAQLVAGFINSDEAKLITAPLTHLGYVSTG